MAGQLGFFDLSDRYAALSAAGDPLERLASVVDFEVFTWVPQEADGCSPTSLLVGRHRRRHPDKLIDRRWTAPSTSQWHCHSSRGADWRKLPDFPSSHHWSNAARDPHHWRTC